ncbi:hypothetical protein ACS0TY_032963 [Phlomoides rotata]
MRRCLISAYVGGRDCEALLRNYRGLGNPQKVLALKTEINSKGPKFVFYQRRDYWLGSYVVLLLNWVIIFALVLTVCYRVEGIVVV